MKKYIVFVICLSFLPLLGEVTLNNFGRINPVKEELDVEYSYEDNEYYVQHDKLKLIGTSLFPIANGYLTIVTEHENIPTWLRLYDKSGNLILTKEFNKIINLSITENGKFAALYNGNVLQVLDITKLQLTSFERSIQFAVNDSGVPIFVDQDENIHFQNHIFSVNENIRTVLFHNEIPLLITEHSIYKIEQTLQKIHTFTGRIFEAKIIENSLYVVIKNNSNYKLLKFDNSKDIEQVDEIFFERSSNRIHEPIFAPLNYGEEDFPFPIGNSYAEIQQYGNTPYLHPGVDYLGDDYQEVYAVHNGFVKAILTTGGDPYWRIAIANEDIPTETQGYLYAHLNENSFTVNVGDEVVAGDFLGTLYPWNYFDFTHTHFSRVFCTGSQWYGDWWTTENNLFDVTNIQDTIPPIFEDAINDERFAFRNSNRNYLDPLDLNGEFDIITKCYDLANHWYWKIDLYDLSYSLCSIDNPDSILFQKFAFVYDFDLDTYINSNVDFMILNTIYSRDATCYSIGNYQEREYYHIITNSNGDSLITEDDATESFDSAQFPDNYYYFKVTAHDASLNTTVDSMLVYFNNGISNSEENLLPTTNYQLSNYPNPFNPSTTISFEINTGNTEDTELIIYNLKGQKVKTFSVILSEVEGRGNKQYSVSWNGNNDYNQPISSGIYFYKLRIDGKDINSNKMILLK